MSDLEQQSAIPFCYLTTTGRVSGRPHRIEIWFALHGQTLYMLAGGGANSDWVKNIQHSAVVSVEIGPYRLHGRGRVVTDMEEDVLGRQLVVGKYAATEDDLDEWGRTALPVAIDLQVDVTLNPK